MDDMTDFPRSPPYKTEFFAFNTFTSHDERTPKELQNLLVKTLKQIPVDMEGTTWEKDCVFYPNETKTAFFLKIFDNREAGKHGSCLIEMQMIEGDRFAFEHLCSHIKQVTYLSDAFEIFGNNDSFVNESAATLMRPYEHAQWKPLPLPPTAEFSGVTTSGCDDDLGLFDSTEMPLMENIYSPFHNVRQYAWRELAFATNEQAMAKVFLKETNDKKSALHELDHMLRKLVYGTKKKGDTIRCLLKVLYNVVDYAFGTQLELVSAMKDMIIISTGPEYYIQTRVNAIALIGKLASRDDRHYMGALAKCLLNTSERVYKAACDGLRTIL